MLFLEQVLRLLQVGGIFLNSISRRLRIIGQTLPVLHLCFQGAFGERITLTQLFFHQADALALLLCGTHGFHADIVDAFLGLHDTLRQMLYFFVRQSESLLHLLGSLYAFLQFVYAIYTKVFGTECLNLFFEALIVLLLE